MEKVGELLAYRLLIHNSKEKEQHIELLKEMEEACEKND